MPPGPGASTSSPKTSSAASPGTPRSSAPRTTRRLAAWRPLVPGRDARVDLACTAALVLLTLVGFRTTYYGWAWLAVGLVGVVLGLLVSHFVTLRRRPAVLTVVYLLLGGPVAVREGLVGGVLPTAGTVVDLAVTAVRGWRTLLTSLPPVDSRGPLMALPFLFGMAGAATAYTVARRWRPAAAALAVPLALLALSIVLGTLTPASVALQGAAFGLVAIGWAALRAGRERRMLASGVGRATRSATAVGLLALALLGGLLLGPHLPGADDAQRTVWRTALEPPFDVTQLPSPLAGFRQYTEPNPSELFDRTLFDVAGLPAGTPVRLATLDSFDGSVWGAGDVAAQAPGEAGGEPSGVGGEPQETVELGLDAGLDIVVELASAGREELDAVVLERVVRRRDHGRWDAGPG